MINSSKFLLKKVSLQGAIILLMGLNSCDPVSIRSLNNSFWEGPHPTDSLSNFYINIKTSGDSLSAKGYWTYEGFYNSTFNVSKVSIDNKWLEFTIPGWNCRYTGSMHKDYIEGGFDCEGEAFDSLKLYRNDDIRFRLTEAKENCLSKDFKYVYEKPVQLNDVIKTGHFASSGDSLFFISLVNKIILGKYGRINSFLVAKDNTLVGEEYFYGYDSERLYQIESSSKSVTSLLFGIAIDQGYIENIDEPIYKIFPEYPELSKGDFRKITIRHLLTMSPGFENKDEDMRHSDNKIDLGLRRILVNTPGNTFSYDGSNTEILGAVIFKKTGLYADQFAKKYLFDPLGISNYDWEGDKQNGYPCVAGSLRMRPRDFMKIGLLVLNEGVYNGVKVVSKDWIHESTSAHIETHVGNDKYGYQWWHIQMLSGKTSYEVIWANGWGSQFIFIIPELELVITTTGYNYEFDSWAIRKGIENNLNLLF